MGSVSAHACACAARVQASRLPAAEGGGAMGSVLVGPLVVPQLVSPGAEDPVGCGACERSQLALGSGSLDDGS